MDTKLATKDRTGNVIAKNISPGNEQASDSFALNDHQDYKKEDLEQILTRDLKWFVNQISSIVFVASRSYGSLVEITDCSLAKQLFNNQSEGYKFLSLTERLQQVIGEVFHDQELPPREPEMDKVYLLSIYQNDHLQESRVVQYAGLTDNRKWYIFNYVSGKSNADDRCWLLKVGYFPRYQSSSNAEDVTLELFTPLT